MELELTTVWSVELAILLRTECHQFVQQGLLSEDFADGDFVKFLSSPKTASVFSHFKFRSCDTDLQDSLKNVVDQWIHEEFCLERELYVLCVGAAALLAFFQDNWTGPSLNSSVLWLNNKSLPEDFESHVLSTLVLDGESLFSPVRHPELLLIARVCLFSNIPNLRSFVWWRFRCLFIHQQILEEWSPQLNEKLHSLKEELMCSDELVQNSELKVLLNLEIAQMHLFYHEVQASDRAIQMALQSSKMSVKLIGALGKRTRFQPKEIPQLTLQVQANEDPVTTSPCASIPMDVALNDDIRLNKISFSDPKNDQIVKLNSLQQACVLSVFVQTQRSQPKDELADEELQAYISFLLSQPLVWSIQFSTLFFRCRVESNHSRTVERSMIQAQELLTAVNKNDPGPWDRLARAFCSHLFPVWHIEKELANLLISLGCINSALDIFLRLQSWEEVIACYNHLNLRHKSAEVINQELAKKETVKLWCLLGDATDDVSCYEKAWNLSGERSARAQRHWGLFFFNRKLYEDAIPHMQQSLNFNSLQVTLWFQLGYAALQVEDWAIAANSYRRYCCLEPENFEAWNNLAKAYVKQGQKNRAWKALQEALKWNFENWHVWDNFMIVSLDCAVFDEVIRAYHRILDLKDKHIDTEVLDITVKAVLENLPDSDGVPSGRLCGSLLELFGRITAQVTSNWKVWHLYSRLTAGATPPTPEALHRAVLHMQKAFRCAVADAAWSRDPSICNKVLELCLEFSKVSLDYAEKNPSNSQVTAVLSSAKLALRAVVVKLKQDHLDLLSGEINKELLPHFQDVNLALEDIVQVLQKLKCN